MILQPSGCQNLNSGSDSGFQVQHKPIKTWLFVAYLGLFLNLGPSLHHADFFGFHNHGPGTSPCGHSHHAAPDSLGSHAANAHSIDSHACSSHTCGHATVAHPNDSSIELTVHSAFVDHDCALCKFFDQYQVTVEPTIAIEAIGFALMREFKRPVDVGSASFPPVARGPPARV